MRGYFQQKQNLTFLVGFLLLVNSAARAMPREEIEATTATSSERKVMPISEVDLKRAKAAYQSNALRLTPIGQVSDKILRQLDIELGSLSEGTFLKNHPVSALALQKMACRSITVSYAVCGLTRDGSLEPSRAWEEQADAVRHFLFSSMVTCSRGKKFAERYMISHEGPLPWNESNEMDIHNNYQAFDYIGGLASKRCSPIGFDKRIVEVALRKIAKKELRTLKTGDTDCSEPAQVLEKLQKMSAKEFAVLTESTERVVREEVEHCE